MAKYTRKFNDEKVYPQVGDHLYLRQFTGNGWVDMVKRPYTVIEVTPSKVKVQQCRLIFNGPVYYDTVADRIEEDPEGRIEELTWHPKRGLWGTKGREADYPQYAIMGEWMHQPYLD